MQSGGSGRGHELDSHGFVNRSVARLILPRRAPDRCAADRLPGPEHRVVVHDCRSTMTKGAGVSRTSAGAELSDALQSVGSATKGKAADTAKKVKTKTVTASDSIASAFDSAARRSWRTRRKTDRRSRVYARKRRRQVARAEHAKLRATAAAASMAEAAAKLVSGDEEVTKNKRPSAKT